LIKQLATNDNTILLEHLNRIAPPAAAGIMPGIGFSAAWVEADRKTQLELRKVTSLILAIDIDAALPHLSRVLQRLRKHLVHARVITIISY